MVPNYLTWDYRHLIFLPVAKICTEKYEYVSVETMEKATKTIIEIAKIFCGKSEIISWSKQSIPLCNKKKHLYKINEEMQASESESFLEEITDLFALTFLLFAV